MKHFIIFLFLLVGTSSFAQVEEVKHYTWDEVPKYGEIPAEFQSYPAVVLKDYRLFDNRIGNYKYKSFVVKHTAIKILTDEGIKDYNKVSINKRYVRDYRDLQARVIKPSGKIELLSKDRIIEKDKSDEKQFVFEGVEKGDIVEYFYVIKDYPDFNSVEYFQRDIPVLDGKFQLNKISEGRAYFLNQGMNEESTKRQFIYTVKNLPAYKFEPNATNLANLVKIYYFVDSNFNYNFISYYRSLNYFADGVNAKSMIKDLVAELNLNDSSVPLDERIRKLDVHIKENVEIVNDYVIYKKIFEAKKMTPVMLLYLYKDVLDYLKIPYNFMASTDRFDAKFDKETVMPSTLSEIMIYIPSTGKYIMPFYYWMPYGPPSSVSLNNDAVTYAPTKKKVEFSFTKVGGVSMDDNLARTTSEVTLDQDMETVSVKKKGEFTGYRSYYYRAILKDMPQDKVNEFLTDAIFSELDVDIKNHGFSNKEYRFNYGNDKPFTIDAQATVKESWVENAGKNYVITLGKVLGEQNNLYQETQRKNPIDIAYPKKYNHNITFAIPSGYIVKDVKGLIFKKELKDDQGKIIGKFASDAKVENGIVSVSIDEFYDFAHLETDKYPAYREVMNAAYDFYKSSIVLTKS